MASSPETPESRSTADRPRLTRVPGPAAIHTVISVDDPSRPAVIRGSIAAELYDGQWTFLIDGSHGSQLLHLDPTMPLGDGLIRIAAALTAASAQAAYPAPVPTEHPEVALRDSRSYGS